MKLELNKSQEVKVIRQLKSLEEFGITPAIPNCKKLKNTNLWELRVLGKDNIRIFLLSFLEKIAKALGKALKISFV